MDMLKTKKKLKTTFVPTVISIHQEQAASLNAADGM
jgi:hypothetical protein